MVVQPAAESKPDRKESEDAPGQDVDQSNLWDSWSSDDDDESNAASGNESGAESEGEQVGEKISWKIFWIVGVPSFFT